MPVGLSPPCVPPWPIFPSLLPFVFPRGVVRCWVQGGGGNALEGQQAQRGFQERLQRRLLVIRTAVGRQCLAGTNRLEICFRRTEATGNAACHAKERTPATHPKKDLRHRRPVAKPGARHPVGQQGSPETRESQPIQARRRPAKVSPAHPQATHPREHRRAAPNVIVDRLGTAEMDAVGLSGLPCRAPLPPPNLLACGKAPQREWLPTTDTWLQGLHKKQA